jgi:hypothetical protein
MNDLKFAFRQLLKNGFTAVMRSRRAGIGANNDLQCRQRSSVPAPFYEPAVCLEANVGTRLSGVTTRVANFLDWRKLNQSSKTWALFRVL